MMTLPNADWRMPPAHLVLHDDEVHVWRAGLDCPAAEVQSLQQMLSADEHARAGRFHFERDRRRYTAARGVLRLLLGRYLNLAAQEVTFVYNAYGKPALAAKPGQALLQLRQRTPCFW